LIADFLSNISAKYYAIANPTMLSRVIAKNIGDVFLRHSVYRPRCNITLYKNFNTLKLDGIVFLVPNW